MERPSNLRPRPFRNHIAFGSGLDLPPAEIGGESGFSPAMEGPSSVLGQEMGGPLDLAMTRVEIEIFPFHRLHGTARLCRSIDTPGTTPGLIGIDGSPMESMGMIEDDT